MFIPFFKGSQVVIKIRIRQVVHFIRVCLPLRDNNAILPVGNTRYIFRHFTGYISFNSFGE